MLLYKSLGPAIGAFLAGVEQKDARDVGDAKVSMDALSRAVAELAHQLSFFANLRTAFACGHGRQTLHEQCLCAQIAGWRLQAALIAVNFNVNPQTSSRDCE